MRIQQTKLFQLKANHRGLRFLLSALLVPLPLLWLSVQAQTLSARVQAPRLMLNPSLTTLTLGQAATVKLALLDPVGKPLLVSSDLAVQLTLTTLPSLDAIKKYLNASASRLPSTGEQKPRLKSLSQQTITLASGQSLGRLEGLVPKGQSEVTFRVVTQQSGQLRLFAEGARFTSGEVVLIAVTQKPTYVQKKKLVRAFEIFGNRAVMAGTLDWQSADSSGQVRSGPAKRMDFPLRLPAVWQTPAATAGLKLELIAPTVPPMIDRNEWAAEFSVALKSAVDEQYLLAQHNISIILRVLQGSARFDPAEITIKQNTALSARIFLRSRPGGKMELAAAPVQANGLRVTEHRLPFEFQLGTCATQLRLRPVKGAALANNQDEIVLEVQAVQKGEDGQEYVVSAENEALAERRISFAASGFGVRFENNQNQIVMPSNEVTGRVKLFSSLPGNVEVSAESNNGLKSSIQGKSTISFRLPVWPIIMAVVGGVIWGLWLRFSRKLSIMQSLFNGPLGAFVFYVAIFFGALLVSQIKLGDWMLNITSLPTVSPLATFVIGLVGGKLSDWLFSTSAKSGP